VLLLVGFGTAVTGRRMGLTAPIVKEFTRRLPLVLLTLSVTAMVQLSYVPSLNSVALSGCVKVTVLFVDVTADEVELPQAPPYVMVPASLEEKV